MAFYILFSVRLHYTTKLQNFFFEIVKMIKKIVINILIFRDKKLNLVFYSFLKPLINKGKTDKNLKKTKKLEKREKIQKKC